MKHTIMVNNEPGALRVVKTRHALPTLEIEGERLGLGRPPLITLHKGDIITKIMLSPCVYSVTVLPAEQDYREETVKYKIECGTPVELADIVFFLAGDGKTKSTSVFMTYDEVGVYKFKHTAPDEYTQTTEETGKEKQGTVLTETVLEYVLAAAHDVDAEYEPFFGW